MTIKKDYNKILEGCKNDLFNKRTSRYITYKCGTHDINNNIILCPSCQARKEVFLERCKDELEFLEKIPQNRFFTREGEEVNIQERILQLKEVLEKK